MCGRYAVYALPEEIAELFGYSEIPRVTLPRFNIKPSQEILVVRERDGKRVAEAPTWGFAPSWSTMRPVINAKAESLREGGRFWRAAVKNGRVLVPMTSGYEWKDAGTKRSAAHAFGVAPRKSLFAVAGLVDNGTAALITCPANSFLSPIHARMPAILAPHEWDAWLTDGDLNLLRPFGAEMYAYPVNNEILKDLDAPECLAEHTLAM